MELFVTIAALILFFGVPYLVTFKLLKSAARGLLERLAGRLEEGQWMMGETLPLGGLGEGNVWGRLDGHPVTVDFRRSVGGGRTVRLAVQLRNPIEDTVSIARATTLARVGRSLGVVSDVKTGDARIDDKYILNGQAQALGGLLAQPEIEACLDRLLVRFPSVRLDAGWLIVERESGALDPDWFKVLRPLVGMAPLFDRTPIRVKVLGEQLRFALTGGGEGARCPYCRDGIDPEALALSACQRCDTVHHSACLDEAGGCVVFGCAGGRARSARVR